MRQGAAAGLPHHPLRRAHEPPHVARGRPPLRHRPAAPGGRLHAELHQPPHGRGAGDQRRDRGAARRPAGRRRRPPVLRPHAAPVADGGPAHEGRAAPLRLECPRRGRARGPRPVRRGALPRRRLQPAPRRSPRPRRPRGRPEARDRRDPGGHPPPPGRGGPARAAAGPAGPRAPRPGAAAAPPRRGRSGSAPTPSRASTATR